MSAGGKALLRSATDADMADVSALLEQSGLPTRDLARSRPRFIVACESGRIVGAGALERYGDSALLRSLVVDARWRGRGLGHRLVKALEREARGAGVVQLVLLTDTAQPFFERLDYRVTERAQVPATVQASEEFRTLCPASSACMLKTLR